MIIPWVLCVVWRDNNVSSVAARRRDITGNYCTRVRGNDRNTLTRQESLRIQIWNPKPRPAVEHNRVLCSRRALGWTALISTRVTPSMCPHGGPGYPSNMRSDANFCFVLFIFFCSCFRCRRIFATRTAAVWSIFNVHSPLQTWAATDSSRTVFIRISMPI